MITANSMPASLARILYLPCRLAAMPQTVSMSALVNEDDPEARAGRYDPMSHLQTAAQAAAGLDRS